MSRRPRRVGAFVLKGGRWRDAAGRFVSATRVARARARERGRREKASLRRRAEVLERSIRGSMEERDRVRLRAVRRAVVIPEELSGPTPPEIEVGVSDARAWLAATAQRLADVGIGLRLRETQRGMDLMFPRAAEAGGVDWADLVGAMREVEPAPIPGSSALISVLWIRESGEVLGWRTAAATKAPAHAAWAQAMAEIERAAREYDSRVAGISATIF